MNILAANDDGINCNGILELSRELEKAGHTVFVVAPDRERSGSSHCLSFTGGMEVKEIRKNFWACRGTPADCVVAGLSGVLGFTVDITVSGINAGANLGTDIVYSGTAAAARQSALLGVPGIAFSLVSNPPFDFSEGARWAAANLEKLVALWDEEIFINVNFPEKSGFCSDIKFAFPVRRRYKDSINFKDGKDGWKILEFGEFTVQQNDDDRGSDSWIVSQGSVAVSRVYIQPAVKNEK